VAVLATCPTEIDALLKRGLEDVFLVNFSGLANHSVNIRRGKEFAERFFRLNARPRTVLSGGGGARASLPTRISYIQTV
jgi:hypothetical protein